MNRRFTVKVGKFEGPLDLLLTLIEERKMLVSDISLSKVADDFIAYVKAQEAFPTSQAAHFILVAATLLLIKSRALLPVFSLSDEEEGDIKELERRLALYAVFRKAGRKLRLLSGRLYFGGLLRDTMPLFSPDPDMTIEALHQAIGAVMLQAPLQEKKTEVSVKPTITLEDMMSRLAARIESALSVTFKDFVGRPEDKREIAVGFLAVLELIKRGTVLAEQNADFGEITMSYMGNFKAPRYD